MKWEFYFTYGDKINYLQLDSESAKSHSINNHKHTMCELKPIRASWERVSVLFRLW